MISFRKPSLTAIRAFLGAQAKLDLSYGSPGMTATEPPAGYVRDHTRARLGQGESVFTAAKAALTCWQHFHLGWVEACPTTTPIAEGAVIAILARQVGLWWLNACRIVYLVDQDGPVRKWGFAYGTLPGHVEKGEECFQVEWHRQQDEVWYDIVALSRPHHFLTKLGYPWVRRAQKRFGRDSVAAMQRNLKS